MACMMYLCMFKACVNLWLINFSSCGPWGSVQCGSEQLEGWWVDLLTDGWLPIACHEFPMKAWCNSYLSTTQAELIRCTHSSTALMYGHRNCLGTSSTQCKLSTTTILKNTMTHWTWCWCQTAPMSVYWRWGMSSTTDEYLIDEYLVLVATEAIS